MNGIFAISYALLWVLIVVLYAAVFLLYRHIGQQLSHQEQTFGPRLDVAANLTLSTIDGTTYGLGPDNSKRGRLVVFAAPTCANCERVRPRIQQRFDKDRRPDLVIVYSGDEIQTRRFAANFRSDTVVVADPSGELARLWRVPGTPYAVVIDAKGVVRNKGILTGSSLKSFSEEAMLDSA
jgi:hypothetical protein